MTPNKFVAVFTSMFEQALSDIRFTEVNLSRLTDVHPSQIPICPSSFIIGFEPDLVAKQKLAMKMIVDQGTALHEALQLFLSADPRTFGNFVCPKCGQFFELTTGGQICPDCEVPLVYREVGINYKGFAGHVDFMVRIDGETWLVDFKSTNYFTMADKVKQTPEMYDLQTLAYCLLLKLQYGIEIKGRAIAYINRDNPLLMKLGGQQLITKKDLKRIHRILKDQKELLNFLLDCKTYKEFMTNVGLQKCSNPYCPVCKLEDQEIKTLLIRKFKELNKRNIRSFIP